MIPQLDSLGRVYTAPSGTPVSWNGGVGYAADGRMCTTLVPGATDTYLGAWRLDPVGRVVVAAPTGTPVFNGGLPFNPNGAIAGQANVVPAAGDPYAQRGFRVNPAGVFGTNAIPP